MSGEVLQLPVNVKEQILFNACNHETCHNLRLVCKEIRALTDDYVAQIRPRSISIKSGQYVRDLFPNIETLDLSGLYEEIIYGGVLGWEADLHTLIKYRLNRDTIRSFNCLSQLKMLVVSCQNLISVWDLLNLLPQSKHSLQLLDVSDSVLDTVLNMILRARNLEMVTLSASLSSFNAFKLLKFIEKDEGAHDFLIDLTVNSHTVNDPESKQVEQLMLSCKKYIRSIAWNGSFVVDPSCLAQMAMSKDDTKLQRVQIECMSDIQWQNLSQDEVESLRNIPYFCVQLQRSSGLSILRKKGLYTLKGLYMHPIWSDQLDGFLSTLQDFPMLSDLRLECNVIMYGLPISTNQFAAMMKSTSLTCLKMRSVNLDLCVDDFKLLGKLSNLKILSIRNSVIGFPETILTVINRMTWLESLELEQGGFNSFKSLTPICRLTSLTELKLKPVLSSTLIHKNTISILLRLKNLQVLNLGITLDTFGTYGTGDNNNNVVDILKKQLVSLRQLVIQ
eukprot:TRINITY_DN31423_c0_g2_i1.p1 TRINITY_DN31423_c0_g2~~TRINITY_DN31423_c0_g2_i1.p1  ORF type:complete len:505 (-),score=18.18 TRINITY_DN31423_c0_g2_i1:1319-2833(-)